MSVFSYSFSSSMTPEGQRKPVTVVLGNALHFPQVVFETGNRAISKTSWCLQGKPFSRPWKHPLFQALLLMPKMVSLRLPCYAQVPDGAIKDGQAVIIATFGNRIYSAHLSFLIFPQQSSPSFTLEDSELWQLREQCARLASAGATASLWMKGSAEL